jgi:hypothetical protein
MRSRATPAACDAGSPATAPGRASRSWTGLADAVESLDALTRPTAGELQRDYFAVCGDHDIAVEEALETVDRRTAQLRWLLGRTAA